MFINKSKIKKLNLKIIDFRSNLEKNKIFFEVLVATSLTFMGIYVSLQANNIAENQTKIMKLENSPRIEIRKTQKYNDSLKIYDINKWYVFNHNSKVSNFDVIKEISFIKLTLKNSYKEINIPLKDYLNIGGIISGESEGLIFEFDNRYTGYNEFLTRQKIWDYGYLEVDSFIKISYDDVLNENIEKYYKINPEIIEIKKEKWDSLQISWEKQVFRSVFLDRNIENNVKQIKEYR